MIKIQKTAVPPILLTNKDRWTQDLLQAVKEYHGYAQIPDVEKSKLLAHYRHEQIKDALFASTHQKCAFCECKPAESTNPEVEHFEPKSLYPELTFEWSNLLPACRKCNEAKSDHDTRHTPIINPAEEDPEALLGYCSLRMKARQGTGQEDKAQATIDICNLNSPRLYEARGKLTINIHKYMDVLKEHIDMLEVADTPQKRRARTTILRNSIDTLDALIQADSTYSAFSKSCITSFAEYHKAKKIIANAKTE